MDSVHSHKSRYIKQPFSSMIVRGSGLYLGFPILFTHLLFIFLYMKIPTLKKHKAPNHLSDIICLGHHIIFFLTKKNLNMICICFKSSWNRIVSLNLFWMYEQHLFCTFFLQFIHSYFISNHIPFHMTENMFCRPQSLNPDRCKPDLSAKRKRFFFA